MPKIIAWYFVGMEETFVDQTGVFFFRWFVCKESACQFRRLRFDPWVRKIPWIREWQPNSIFLLGKFTDRGAWWAITHGVAKSQTPEQRSTHTNVSCFLQLYCFIKLFTKFCLEPVSLLHPKQTMRKLTRQAITK